MILDNDSAETQASIALHPGLQILDLTRGEWLYGVIYVDTDAGICRRVPSPLEALATTGKPDATIVELRGRFAIVWPDNSDSQT